MNAGQAYPIHKAVFENDQEKLRSLLKDASMDEIDKVDIHGRTPLMLATVLGHVDCGRILLKNGANAIAHNRRKWSVYHEAVILGDPHYLRRVNAYINYQRACHTRQFLIDMRESLKKMPDFYVELSWEFNTWLRIFKYIFPSDTHKIYKSGSAIRIDITLLDYDTGKNCKRGLISLIFRLTDDGKVESTVIDYVEKAAEVCVVDFREPLKFEDFKQSDNSSTLHSPLESDHIDVDNVVFERAKSSSFFQWTNSVEREEVVDGIACKVFKLSNFNVGFKSRREHLSTTSKKQENEWFAIMLGLLSKKSVINFGASTANGEPVNDLRSDLTADQYLTDPDVTDQIGKKGCDVIKHRSFGAEVYVAEKYPLNAQDHIFPILDFISLYSTPLTPIKDFLKSQLPYGFPVRINIPLIQMISLQITLKNMNKPSPDDHEMDDNQLDEEGQPILRLKKSLFEIPADFTVKRTKGSLLFDDLGDIPEEKSAPKPAPTNIVVDEVEYDFLQDGILNDESLDPTQASSSRVCRDIQLEIEQSYADASVARHEWEQLYAEQICEIAADSDTDAVELAEAIRLSEAEEKHRKNNAKNEDEELAKVIELSKIYF